MTDNWLVEAIASEVEAKCPFTDESLSKDEIREIVKVVLSYRNIVGSVTKVEKSREDKFIHCNGCQCPMDCGSWCACLNGRKDR